jgi:hypothetical protein
MKAKLLKDIVIPAGTIFHAGPSKIENYGNDHVEHIFGFSNDTFGRVMYAVGETPESEERIQLKEYFEVIEE